MTDTQVSVRGNERKFSISLLHDDAATIPALRGKIEREVETTWSELPKLTTKHVYCLSTFTKPRRTNSNFKAAAAIALDFDSGKLTIREAKARGEALDLAFSIETTRNHQKVKGELPACDRFRMIFPSERLLTTDEEYRKGWHLLQTQFPECDPAAKDPARFYFKSEKHIAQQAGKPFRSPIAESPVPILASQKPVLKSVNLDSAEKWAIEYLTDAAPAAVRGSGNTTVYQIGQELKAHGVPLEAARRLIVEVYNPRLDDPWLPREIDTLLEPLEHGYRYKGLQEPGSAAAENQFDAVEPDATPAPKKRPRIEYASADLPALADRVERAMLDHAGESPLLSYGGRYATVERAKPITPMQVEAGACLPAIHRYVDASSLIERAMQAADFFIWSNSKEAFTPSRVPADILDVLIHRRGGKAPALTGLSSVPVLCRDGTLIETPGYNAKTGLYCTFRENEFKSLPEKPSQADAERAFQYLKTEAFADFPFREEVDLAVAVAALLTGLVRATCGPCPAFMISAPLQSSGKTALAQMIGQIVTGALPGLLSWPESEEELEKELLAALLRGMKVVLFDNLRNGIVIRSDKLAKLITAEIFDGRILGKSEIVTVPSSILTLLTVNNPSLEGDMPSRILECYLDPKLERPDQRRFKRELGSWVQEHRGKVVREALVLIRAYMLAKPDDSHLKANRFPVWDRMVRRPIVWAGGADINEKFDSAYAMDPTLGLVHGLLESWIRVIGTRSVTSGELFEKVDPKWQMASLREGEVAKFAQAMLAFVADRRGVTLTAKTIGQRLAGIVNRRFGDFVLTAKTDNHRRVQVWSVTQNAGNCGTVAGNSFSGSSLQEPLQDDIFS